MEKIILLAGATGNLGQRICRELINLGVKVRAIVREESDPEKVKDLEDLGVDVHKIDLGDERALTASLIDTSCVVSAVAGLHDVIVKFQLLLLNSAISAGVPRFIPSDFCTEYLAVPEGENRNFDLRREFRKNLDSSEIKAVSIFNGCFAEVLKYNTPLFDIKKKTITYYESKKDWQIEFTSMDDTAAFTAAAALDENAPRDLNIASFRVSPAELALVGEKLFHEQFQLVENGSMQDFSKNNALLRSASPEGEKELYPKWQQAQYMYSMFLINHSHLDNKRYPLSSWTTVEETLKIR